MKMCPCRAQPGWQIGRGEWWPLPRQTNTLPTWSQDGLQTFFNAPSPSHHQSLKTNGRRPGEGGLCSKPQSGFPLVLLVVKHTAWNSAPLQTHGHCGTRKPHQLDEFPYLQNSVSSSIKWAVRYSQPFLAGFMRHP